MAILNLPTFTEQKVKTPEEKLLESLQQMQIERPQAEVPRFTRYGNRMAERGGFDVLPQEQLRGMTQQQVDEYEAERRKARGAGISETLMRVGQAFAGQDADAGIVRRQQARQAQEQQAEQKAQMQAFKDVPKNISARDYGSNKEYYTALGKSYMSKGFIDQGIKFLELGKPATPTDLTKQLISSRKDEQKTFNAVKSAVNNYKQIMDAAESKGGAASYALMVKFIKQLDDSVVKEGEVRTFGDFQGVAANFKNAVNKASGEGFTGQTKAEILNLARKTVDRLIKDYNDYRGGTDIFYNQIGLSPELLFSGLELNTEGLDLGKTYTAQDFETEIIDVID